MAKFLLRRFVNYLILAFIAASLAYMLAGLALNPRAKWEGMNPRPPESSIDAQLDALNANDKTSILVRYKNWVGDLFQGDLGKKIQGGEVSSEMGRRIGVSLRLMLIGTVVGAVVGVLLGAWSAVKQYQWPDHLITFASYVVIAAPVLVLAVALKIIAVKVNDVAGMQLLAYAGEYDPTKSGTWTVFVDRLKHLILPTISISLGLIASYSRYQRSTMLDVLGSDFLRTAQAKGLRRRKALMKHGLRTALIPLATFLVYTFGLLLTGATLTEWTFGWHGMGEWFVQSVTANDVNAVAAVTLFFAVLVLIAGMLSDVIYAALDPRVRVS